MQPGLLPGNIGEVSKRWGVSNSRRPKHSESEPLQGTVATAFRVGTMRIVFDVVEDCAGPAYTASHGQRRSKHTSHQLTVNDALDTCQSGDKLPNQEWDPVEGNDCVLLTQRPCLGRALLIKGSPSCVGQSLWKTQPQLE